MLADAGVGRARVARSPTSGSTRCCCWPATGSTRWRRSPSSSGGTRQLGVGSLSTFRAPRAGRRVASATRAGVGELDADQDALPARLAEGHPHRHARDQAPRPRRAAGARRRRPAPGRARERQAAAEHRHVLRAPGELLVADHQQGLRDHREAVDAAPLVGPLDRRAPGEPRRPGPSGSQASTRPSSSTIRPPMLHDDRQAPRPAGSRRRRAVQDDRAAVDPGDQRRAGPERRHGGRPRGRPARSSCDGSCSLPASITARTLRGSRGRRQLHGSPGPPSAAARRSAPSTRSPGGPG